MDDALRVTRSFIEPQGPSPMSGAAGRAKAKTVLGMSDLVLRKIAFNFDDVDSVGSPYDIAFAIMMGRVTVHNPGPA